MTAGPRPALLSRTIKGLRNEGVLLAALAGLIYWFSAVWADRHHTPDTAYFQQLADAFLHGRLHLIDPAATHDLTQYHDKWFVPFPPLAAILMMPYVLIVGVSHVNTVLFAAVLGGINVFLADRLLRTLNECGMTKLTKGMRRWLVLMWALGTIHWYTSTQGTVWFLAHVCAVTFLFGALNSAVRGRSIAAGMLLGIAVLSRPTTMFMAPALIGLVVASRRSSRSALPVESQATDGSQSQSELEDVGIRTSSFADDKQVDGTTPPKGLLVRVGAKVGLPVAAFASVLLLYNRLRFGRFTEFGYGTENVDPSLVAALSEFGQFNVHFIKKNLWAMLLAGPEWVRDRFAMSPNPEGMSMLLTTPALLYATQARLSNRVVRWCWLAIGLVLIPLMTYYNTGWYQFGFRFAFDFLPVLFVLVAIGVGQRISLLGRAAILFGVVVNFWGMAWFNGK